MFNKRHYNFVAEVLKKSRSEIDIALPEASIRLTTLSNAAWDFAEAFKQDNPLFDEDRFFNATVEGVSRQRKA